MSNYLLLLLGALVLGLYLLYALIWYFLSRAIIPTDKLIKMVFIVSAALVMLASILGPLDIINFVFIASLFVASVVAWLLHSSMSRGGE